MAPPLSLSESRVLDLVSRYRAVHELHPLVSEMFSSEEFEGIFQDALKHEQYIISRRSQDLADNEITLAQKAFAMLSDDQADYYAATALWVEEVLGINVVPVENKPSILSAVVKAKSFTPDRLQECQRAHGDYDSQNYCEGGPEDEALCISQRSSVEDRPSSAVECVQQEDIRLDNFGNLECQPFGSNANLKRLMNVYKEARCDFDAAPPKSLDRTKAAKFLRDTIENCQSYLKSQQYDLSSTHILLDQNTLDEMEKILEQTCAIVEKGSGGKKRSFDEGFSGEASEPSKANPQTDLKASFKPLRIFKTSSNAVSLVNGKSGEAKLGRYPVTIHHERPRPISVKHYGDRPAPDDLHGSRRSFHRQRDYQHSFSYSRHRRSLSPPRLRSKYRHQSPRRHLGREHSFTRRAGLCASPEYDTYRPSPR